MKKTKQSRCTLLLKFWNDGDEEHALEGVFTTDSLRAARSETGGDEGHCRGGLCRCGRTVRQRHRPLCDDAPRPEEPRGASADVRLYPLRRRLPPPALRTGVTISAHLRMINFSRKGVFFRTGKRRFDITNCYIKTKLPLAIPFQRFRRNLLRRGYGGQEGRKGRKEMENQRLRLTIFPEKPLLLV